MNSKILIFGDIFGKPGRRALKSVLPVLREEYSPDVVIANVENLAHGKGVTLGTLSELKEIGVDVFTSGNHVFDKPKEAEEAFAQFPELIRPANYGEVMGRGFYRFEQRGQGYLVINLGGVVFFDNQYRGEIKNPFLVVEQVMSEQQKENDIIIIDFHAEATSEKAAMGFHIDSRATVLVGTHTHVPTADARILPGGTAFVTDLGMTGPLNSVIGVKVENAMRVFLNPEERFRMEPEEEGQAVVNAVLVTTEKNKAVKIERIQKQIN